MERSTVIALDALPSNAAAVLTLKSGVSGFCIWSFDACDVGATISVGACERCDWQVVAPGVAPIALLFTGQTLFVKSERLCDKTLLNGAPLWPGWVPLEHGDCLELGSARLEVSIPARFTSSRSAASCPNDATMYVRDVHDARAVNGGVTPAPADWYVRAAVENASYVPTQAERVCAREEAFVQSAHADTRDAAHGQAVTKERTAHRSGVHVVPDRRIRPLHAEVTTHADRRRDVHVITAPQWGATHAAVGAQGESVRPNTSFAHPTYIAESTSSFMAELSVKRSDRVLVSEPPPEPPPEHRSQVERRPEPVVRQNQARNPAAAPHALSDSPPAARSSAWGVGDEASFFEHRPLYRHTIQQWSRPEKEAAKSHKKPRTSFVPESAEVVAKMSRATYAALGLLTVLAYAGWIVVLDHL